MLSGATVVIQAMPLSDYPAEKYAAGFNAVVASVRRNETSPASRIKSCNYLDNVFARLEAAAAGADEGLMLNIAGHVACGSICNVFAVQKGHLLTPPVSTGILPGITRGVVLEIAAREGIPTAEADLTLSALRASDEAFLTNSLIGLMPLTQLDGRPIGPGTLGPLTRLLRQRYLTLLAAETHQ
jgi:branched-subunit amino acid aminotransferase/4-amino-4-deoxychorismate lyase